MQSSESPFLDPGAKTRPNTLAIIQLSKDDLVPVYLRETQGEHDGYKEGHVLNTRFGSFPHSTLIGVTWGAQVRASNVDTGSRGRRKNKQKAAQDEGASSARSKRKRDINDDGEKQVDGSISNDIDAENEEDGSVATNARQDSQHTSDRHQKTNTTIAKSGFVHILPPTPEIWTSSLPHRTQVVYTPDYSYILQRIRARPGSRLIESGSGSGSFTHAAARAVYNGRPGHHNHPSTTGKVFSFEFHEQRFEKLKGEIGEHGLEGLVEINHRDVYNDGFLVDGKSPEADAIFLDLPAPWLALPHLSRRKPKTGNEMEGVQSSGSAQDDWVSPLNPRRSAYICTFSPCIEQVTRTVLEMRKLGWVEIEMFEIAHKRIQVYREKLGLDIVSERGMQQAPKDVAEAIVKLKEIEVKAAEHNAKMVAATKGQKKDNDNDEDDDDMDEDVKLASPKQARKQQVVEEDYKNTASSNSKIFMQGQLVTRPEAEVKAHTSYLVFAILPREWTDEDEAAAAAKWPIGKENKVIGAMDRASRKQQKREQIHQKSKKNQKQQAANPHQPRSQQQQPVAAAKADGGSSNDADNTTTTTNSNVKTEDAVMEDVPVEKV